MEGRSIVRCVMEVKPSMKHKRAEDDDKNASHCQSWKKRMIKRAAEDDETWKKMDENIKIGVLDANFMRQSKLLEARIKNVTNKKRQDFGSCNGGKEHSTSLETIMSREKALRAAMLKSRFADTIHRAAQTLFPDKKSDLRRTMQQQKELKKRRQRERKALEEIEKRAEVDSTATTLKMWFGPTGYPTPEPLQRLGLHIINDQEEECCLDEYSFSYSVGFNEARLLSHRDL